MKIKHQGSSLGGGKTFSTSNSPLSCCRGNAIPGLTEIIQDLGNLSKSPTMGFASAIICQSWVNGPFASEKLFISNPYLDLNQVAGLRCEEQVNTGVILV